MECDFIPYNGAERILNKQTHFYYWTLKKGCTVFLSLYIDQARLAGLSWTDDISVRPDWGRKGAADGRQALGARAVDNPPPPHSPQRPTVIALCRQTSDLDPPAPILYCHELIGGIDLVEMWYLVCLRIYFWSFVLVCLRYLIIDKGKDHKLRALPVPSSTNWKVSIFQFEITRKLYRGYKDFNKSLTNQLYYFICKNNINYTNNILFINFTLPFKHSKN